MKEGSDEGAFEEGGGGRCGRSIAPAGPSSCLLCPLHVLVQQVLLERVRQHQLLVYSV